MKRSRTAALLLMGSAPLLFSACSSEPDGIREGLYTSVEACIADTNDSATCNEAFQQAEREAVAEAPRFASREACAAEYGQDACVERSEPGTQHSFFGPLMTGFLVSRLMSGATPAAGFRSAPAFRDRAGQWQRPAPAGGAYRSTPGTMQPVTQTPNHTTTVRRAGFGSRSHGRSSFGG